jgi:predicted ABC-type ATPase
VSRLDLVVGPNGGGKSTFVAENLLGILPPGTPFVNADEIAKVRFPGEEMERSREAARIAEATRERLIAERLPFIAETVFSHPSKLELVDQAVAAGYYVKLHVLAVPPALAVARVRYRVSGGGHDVPPDKIVERWHRLWPLVADAIRRADSADVWDNTRQDPPDRIAQFVGGLAVSRPRWPEWIPAPLHELV